jgi:hypothetical protein
LTSSSSTSSITIRPEAMVFVAVLVLLACGLAGCAGTASTSSTAPTTADGTADPIPITVMKPDGPGPFPAVVIMHDRNAPGGRGATTGGDPPPGPTRSARWRHSSVDT